MRLVLLLLCCSSVLARPVQDYLPAGDYSPAIPVPRSVLGWEVGQWHVRHDQLVAYHRALAAASDRVQIETIGYSHEQRPLTLMTVTHPDNFARLDELLTAHREGRRDAPLVLWFGYSVHGNEPSGANAGLIFAYYLAALRDGALEDALRNTVILIEPAINPDGLSRFAQWANMHKSTSAPVADRANREHQEVWPGGRFNHYWFDLNRDWLLLTHPESRARIKHYQKWRPHVLTDFHEMGSDATYFFQPGVPERTNPLTPQRNTELTAKLATYHAKAFDAQGELYYSEEQFDDFYYGKGSTYPDVQGTIGILFEQASSRGHLMSTVNGELSFPQTIANQVTASLSTLEGSLASADELTAYQRQFYADAAGEAGRDRTRAYVFGDSADPVRSRQLASIISQHGIDVYAVAQTVESGGSTFSPGSAWVVPTGQRQYRLIKAMFETRTEFADNTFYDVSAWTMPLAFNLPFATLRSDRGVIGTAFAETAAPAVEPPSPSYAWALRWSDYDAPKALAALLADGIRVKVATKPFSARTSDGIESFARGTVLVAPGINREKDLAAAVRRSGGRFVEITSGLTPRGIDLGSPSQSTLEPVRPLIVVGPGVSPLEVGEVWHLLDTRVSQTLTMVDKHRLPQIALDDYTHLLLVHGNYSDLDDRWLDQLRGWVRVGGIVIATKGGAAWVTDQLLGKNDDDDQAPGVEPERRDYADFADDFAKTVIGGAIVQGDLDITHPLGYGYTRRQLPLLHNGSTFFATSENPYETVLQYADEPLLAGFIGEERQLQMGGSAAVLADRVGRGAVVRFSFNPNFRGVWYGTNKLYLNALYFSQLINNTPVPDTTKLR